MVFRIFLILICGLPFCNFLFNKPDIWHGQGHYFQIGILFLLAWSFIEKPKYLQAINKPLGLFFLWSGILTSHTWIKVLIVTKNYPVKLLLSFINVLCFVIFYKLSVEYLDKNGIEKILKYLKYSILGIVFYCVLQILGLDQFLRGLSGHDELVGTIGNPSHLAGYLALCQPLFFDKSRFNVLALILLWMVLIMANSASGAFVGIAVLLFWLLMKKKYLFSGVIFGITSLLLFFIKPTFFIFSHRLEMWKLLLPKFIERPLTGNGLGIMNVWMTPLTSVVSIFRHAHQEYYQLAIELGLVGLVLVLWGIWDYFNLFRTFKTDLTIKLASIFFGFCLLGLFTFNAHLWLMSCLGMISYSWLYALKNNSETQIVGV